MGWTVYLAGLLIFNTIGALTLYLLQRLQPLLPLNPARLGAVVPDSAFNTAISFATNTSW
jgi:K+-transporting ATPase ATPase A chain